ncbi:MAG: helix-turn-helix domain-containing protein [Pseudodesulfovibrio sp.]|jgi:excisionase family DNA binding protein|uniref:Excisionase n=1 Tax=Pseudodesulfovibrio indicus TaxID=1716143 RepID=A0A126QJH2_9BACT|nr:helix-turn-helix domain-containing protein [Pseudodesulfovibrio indicus]AMK10130.1 excisionase [Pseudodesulfovibrio indicus]TDT87832.1 excisionase family DNA binding protein [Pseudodesulfovibrio indicus]
MDSRDVPKPPKLLTVREVADYLRVHQRTAYRLITGGDIKAVKIGSQWRVPEQSLMEFIESGMNAPVPTGKKEREPDQFKLPLD